ncbi:MAG: ABC transporter permease [Variovorax sp.]
MNQASRINLIRGLTLVGLWFAWEGLARSGLLYRGVVPSTFSVLAAAWKHLTDPAFYPHVLRTLQEVGIGFVIGAFFGLALPLLMGRVRLVGGVVDNYVQVLAPTPKIVFLPVLLVLFGVDAGSKIAMGAASAFFPVAVATFAALRQVNPVLINVARSFNATLWQTITKLYLPSMAEPVLSGMRLGLGVAIIGVLLAEIKLSNRGLGFLTINHYNAFRIPDMYAVLLIVFVFAAIANALIGRLSRRYQRA